MEGPPEILHEIFALACTDTGLTGQSLSLVSKQFNEISRPFKYQSIAIARWRQLIAFAQTFTQLPESLHLIQIHNQTGDLSDLNLRIDIVNDFVTFGEALLVFSCIRFRRVI